MEDPSPPLQSPTPSKVSMQNGPPPRVRGAPRPRLLLQGQRRSGKSSISSVVFHKMPPTETLFLESTTRIQKEPVNTFMDFQVWDFPGQIDYNDGTFDLEAIFSDTGALIYVIDAQDEYLEALTRLHQTIITIQRFNPSINVEVFIHKVDGLSDDFKLDTQRDIVQRTTDELADLGFDSVHINYHLTSIYDHSIFEAFSKVIQKLLPELGTLENLLNGLVSNCRIEKAFLFDVLSKIYVATDSSPVDVQSYEICSDYIDVVLDMTEIYGYDRGDSSEVSTVEESKSSMGSTNAEDWSLPDQSSVMKLQNGMVLFLREINKFLALICIMRKESFEKRGLIDYNVQVFQQALEKVFELHR
ncbi:GTP-binding protein gtr2, variant 2 [Orbilia brochopaga]|uniref:GTP-binding protein n=1 Tax=Orbilia brochopaga TaxID=3140254 RepID=A0AAV9V6H1_9PEZI